MFKNEISRRFYDWCKVLIDNGEITVRQLSDVVGKYQSNPSNVLGNLKNGTISVPFEWIVACQYKFGLNPGILFDATPGIERNRPMPHKGVESEPWVMNDGGGIAEAVLPEPSPLGHAGPLLHKLLHKHGIKIEQYAHDQLGISRQQFHSYLNGSSRLFFDVVLRICEDLGESLDQFRTRPLPQGHLLDRVKHLQDQLKDKDAMINELTQKLHRQGG